MDETIGTKVDPYFWRIDCGYEGIGYEIDNVKVNFNVYVYWRSDVTQYIGHYFNKQTLDENNSLVPEVVFNAFDGQYLEVPIGKGLITLEEMAELLERCRAGNSNEKEI